MKTKSKALLLTLCAVLLVAASVLGTMAYLTDTGSVTNTFTVGKVAITLDEAKVNADGTKVDKVNGKEVRTDANEYKLMPGHTYVKDPTIHVDASSEDCFIRAKVTLTNATAWTTIVAKYAEDEIENIIKGTDDDLWWVSDPVPNADGSMTITFVYKNETKAESLKRVWQSTDKKDGKALTDLVLFDTIAIPGDLTNAELASVANTEITVVAEAIQADGFVEDSNDATKAAAAYTAAMAALDSAMAPAPTAEPEPTA